MTNDDASVGGAGAASFDTLAGIRTLGEIQRRGLKAANDVVARLTAQSGATPLFGAETPTDSDLTGDPIPAGFEPRLYQAMAEQFISFVSSVATSFGAPGPSNPAAEPGAASLEPLQLPPTVAGTSATGVMWLHNRTGASLGSVGVHCGELRSSDGDVISAEQVQFDPADIDDVPDLTSRGITVTVHPLNETVPGTYRGLVSVTNHPDLWLPLVVEVRAR